MKKKMVYEDLKEMNGVPLGKIGDRIVDFLPSPAELAGKNETVKITLSLDKESLSFFKKTAKRHKSSYQRMIRNLLSSYSKLNSSLS